MEDGVLMKKIWLRIISGKRLYKKKRKVTLLLIGYVLIFSLSGCNPESAGEYRARVIRDEQNMADEMMQAIIDALEEQDVKAMKEMFSTYAIEHAENLDEKIAKIMEFYPGSNEGYEGNCSSMGGKYYSRLILYGTYDVMNDGQVYEIRFITMPHNDEEPDKVGLYLIEVMTEEAKPEGFKWKNEEDEPGIYVLEPQEKHW